MRQFSVRTKEKRRHRMTYELCHLLPSLGPGGAENLLLEIVRKTRSEPVDHTVCFFEDDSYLRHAFEEAGATVQRIAPGIVDIPYIDPVTLMRTTKYFRQNRFDVITAHVYVTHHLGRLGGLVGGASELVSVHHNTRNNYHPVIANIERYTRNLDSVTVAVSNGVNASLQPADRHHDWRVIHNGIDVQQFRDRTEQADTKRLKERLGLTDKYPIFLNVGRYSRQKSQDDIIRALDRITGSFDSPHLLLVGQRGDLETELESLVDDMELSDNVTITGRVDNIYAYYAVADIFVLSSVREGFGIVLLEAMAAGLPIVATDIPAVSEVLNDEIGMLVPPNAPSQLATAMREITDSESTFSTDNVEYVSANYDIETTATAYLNLYRELIARQGETHSF